MDALFRKHNRLLAGTSMAIMREKMGQIHWNAQIISIMGAKGVLVSFSASGEFPMKELEEVMNTIRQYTSSSAIIKPGITYDPTINKDSLKVVVIAANFPDNDDDIVSIKNLQTGEASNNWIPLNYKLYVPAIKWWHKEVK